MLQIEIKKKIKKVLGFSRDNRTYKNWINYEDVLVSAVFGIAAYLPFESIMGPILKAACPLCGSEKYIDDLIENDVIKVELWPRIGEYEFDGLWELKDRIVIIEAKRPQNILTANQIINYLKITNHELPQLTKRTIWVLAVAKGSPSNIRSVTLPNNCNLLYIDWTTIQNVANKQRNYPNNNNIKRALNDVNKFLSERNLKSFGGFHWPEDIMPLADFERFVEINSKWFHYQPITWPNLPPKSIEEFNFILENSTPLLFH